jgi:hypothetical protein
MKTVAAVAVLLLASVSVACVTTPQQRPVDPALRAEIVRVVVEAERKRLQATLPAETVSHGLAALDKWINVVVDDEPVVGVAGVAFHVARNEQIDPPVGYVVAQAPSGELFRLAGFDERRAQFDRLVGVVLLNRSLADTEAVDLADAYFQFVEQWTPGIPDRWDRTGSVVSSAAACANNRRATVQRVPEGYSITALVFDSRSGRLECVNVVMSSLDGLEIVRRTTLVDRRHIDL